MDKKATAPHSKNSSKKTEARELKKKRIEENGGVRPRKAMRNDTMNSNPGSSNNADNKKKDRKKKKTYNKQSGSGSNTHRFGKVMEDVPCPNRARDYTVSIAIAGSVVGNAQTNELSTYLIGQIGRAAVIYHVDEIVVFDDKLADVVPASSSSRRRRREEDNDARTHTEKTKTECHVFMAKILQYMECPQYLRRHFFPMHPDYRSVGVLPPLDAPHHVRAYQKPPYREGITQSDGTVNVGLSKPISIDRSLVPNLRVTVQIKDYDAHKGIVVSPSTPRETNGMYWGYTTRIADSLSHVFSECPFSKKGYDFKIGTSERGHVTVDDPDFTLITKGGGGGDSSFHHLIIVFGGVAGIEECVDADESLQVGGQKASTLFDLWLNTCPFQGSRTIRTEEAILLSLARLHPFITKVQQQQKKQDLVKKSTIAKPDAAQPQNKDKNVASDVEFSDASPSEESSSGSEED